MCEVGIFFKPPKRNTLRHYIKKAYQINRHGIGILWVDNNSFIHIRKFLDYEELLLPTDYTFFAFHCRYATSGTRNLTNTQPIVIKNIAVFHNGIMSEFEQKPSEFSDTYHYTLYLTALFEKHGWSAVIQNVLSQNEQCLAVINLGNGDIVAQWHGYTLRNSNLRKVGYYEGELIGNIITKTITHKKQTRIYYYTYTTYNYTDKTKKHDWSYYYGTSLDKYY